MRLVPKVKEQTVDFYTRSATRRWGLLLSGFEGPAVTEQIDRKADTTRRQILRAASHQFAHKSYSVVCLDDILAEAEVTKGAMYFHFRSKHALAVAIVEQRAAMAHDALDELVARKLSGLETLVDMSYLIAVEDIGNDFTRAGLNLLESVGRSDQLQASVVGRWVTSFAEIGRRAISEGDVVEERDPEAIARLIVSMYLGLRQISNLAEPEPFLSDLEKSWILALPGFVNPDRLKYFTQFIRRRTAGAIRNATPLRPGIV